jgi:hypothetical protein
LRDGVHVVDVSDLMRRIVSDSAGERRRGAKRLRYVAPPAANANFDWARHIVHHLAVNGGSSARNTRRLGVA